MKKRGKTNILMGLLTLVMIFSIVQLAFSLFFARSDTLGPTITGKISFELNDLKDNYLNLSPLAKSFIIAEWLVVIVLVSVVFIKRKSHEHKEKEEDENVIAQQNLVKYQKQSTETEIDLLHKMLIEKKSLRMETISAIFKVSKETAMSWSKILEDANIAVIDYPAMGDPKIVLNENEEKVK